MLPQWYDHIRRGRLRLSDADSKDNPSVPRSTVTTTSNSGRMMLAGEPKFEILV